MRAGADCARVEFACGTSRAMIAVESADVGALVARVREAFPALARVAANRLTFLASGGTRIAGDDDAADAAALLRGKRRVMVIAGGGSGSLGAEALRAEREAKRRATPAAAATRASSRDRASAWRATGIVGARDVGATSIDARIFEDETLAAKVRVLDYSRNAIRDVDPRIERLKNVTRIVLRENDLISVPWESLAALRLTFLDVSGNARLGGAMATPLAFLQTLNLARCGLTSEQLRFDGFASLRHVRVAGNKLKTLPDFADCPDLEVIDASENEIAVVPAALGRLRALRSLNLAKNAITLAGVPSALLTDASSLVELVLHDNPISMESLREIQGWDAFDARRRARASKSIESSVMLSSTVFDEGGDVDRFVRDH